MPWAGAHARTGEVSVPEPPPAVEIGLFGID
jgi:hypothetical protein